MWLMERYFIGNLLYPFHHCVTVTGFALENSKENVVLSWNQRSKLFSTKISASYYREAWSWRVLEKLVTSVKGYWILDFMYLFKVTQMLLEIIKFMTSTHWISRKVKNMKPKAFWLMKLTFLSKKSFSLRAELSLSTISNCFIGNKVTLRLAWFYFIFSSISWSKQSSNTSLP